MDSIDDLTCKLGSLTSDQQTNDTLSPNRTRNSDILTEIKKSLVQNTKTNFPLRDQIYNQILQMRTIAIAENFSHQMCSMIIFSEYQDNSTLKIENIKQILQDCTNLNLKTFFIAVTKNKKNINLKEVNSLVSQFPCSLHLIEINIDELLEHMKSMIKDLSIGSLKSKFFIHVSTNKAMQKYLEPLVHSLSTFESMLTKDDKVYWSTQICDKIQTVEIQESDTKKEEKETKRKYVFYTFVAFVSIAALCYILYAIIVPLT